MFGNESSPLISVMGMKVPGNESSKERKFHLWNFHPLDALVRGESPHPAAPNCLVRN